MKTKIMVLTLVVGLWACTDTAQDRPSQATQPGRETPLQMAQSQQSQETQPGRESLPQSTQSEQLQETQRRREPPPQRDEDRPSQETQPRKEPPPQAYTDCKGKRAGETVQHMTREGLVAATCEDTPQGLVARPVRQPNDQMHERERNSQKDSQRPEDQIDERRPQPPPRDDRNLTR